VLSGVLTSFTRFSLIFPICHLLGKPTDGLSVGQNHRIATFAATSPCFGPRCDLLPPSEKRSLRLISPTLGQFWTVFERILDRNKEVLRGLENYLIFHSGRMNYRERLAAGQASESGQEEGVCKNLIGARLKQTGAKRKRVHRMATLWAILYGEEWNDYRNTAHWPPRKFARTLGLSEFFGACSLNSITVKCGPVRLVPFPFSTFRREPYA